MLLNCTDSFRFGHGLAVVFFDDIRDGLKLVAEPINKAVAQLPEGTFTYIMRRKQRSDAPSLFVLKEIVVNYPLGFAFKYFSPFFETFNDMIGRMLSHGFFKEMNEQMVPSRRKQRYDIGPQILKMEHLDIAFIACLIPLGFAVAGFLLEIIVQASKKSLKSK